MKPTKIISLGAGVQSSAMVMMAARGVFGEDYPKVAVFADTGWEPSGVYAHLDWLENEAGKYGIKIVRASKGNLRDDFFRSVKTGDRVASIPFFVRNEDGTKGMLWRQCTSEYKIGVVRKEIRRLLGYQPRSRVKEHVELWMGISTDEIQRVKPSQVKFITNKYPLIDCGFSRMDCIRWMVDHGYPEPPKSSCIGCPYHNDAHWLDMKENDPQSWEEAVEFDRFVRNGLPKVKGEVYLHRSCKSLDEIEFDKKPAYEQLDLFNNECEGMCGI